MPVTFVHRDRLRAFVLSAADLVFDGSPRHRADDDDAAARAPDGADADREGRTGEPVAPRRVQPASESG